VDAESRKVYLTHKKSLVNASNDVPASYEGLKPGMQLEGFILSVKDKGVVVCFCNRVKVSPFLFSDVKLW
jgi:ribosomal protein S1